MGGEGVTLALVIAPKRSTSRAGRSTGGVDARIARERFARPPAGTAPTPHLRSHPECALRRVGCRKRAPIYRRCQQQMKLSAGVFLSDGKHATFFKTIPILRGQPMTFCVSVPVTPKIRSHKDSQPCSQLWRTPLPVFNFEQLALSSVKFFDNSIAHKIL
jgi:hypothetical protein